MTPTRPDGKASVKQASNRLFSFFRKKPLDQDLNEEMASHIEMATEENVRRGLSPEEARRQALVRFGGVQQAAENHRETRGLPWLDVLGHDLRFALRTMRRDRSFTIIAVVILALGIGANIAVFSVVNTILLRPLPFPQSQNLVWIAPPPSSCGMSCATYSSDAYEEFRDQARSYDGLTGYFAFSSPDNLRLSGHGDPIPLTGIDVISNFFQVMGVQPQMGRLFTEADARAGAYGAPAVVVLSHAWWKRQLAGDPNIVGKGIDLNGKQATVIGVLPASFDFGGTFAPGDKIDVFTPLNLDEARSWGNIVTLIGRLKPGVTVQQAAAEAKIIAPNLYHNAKRPETKGAYKKGLIPVPLKDYVSGKLRRSLVLLWSAVGLILLIVCVNLSNLLLARSSARRKEFAMRSALGAGRGRIVRQLLTESFVLSFSGALIGLGLAAALLTWLAHQGSLALPLLANVRIDGSALSWTIIISIGAAAFFGIMPALKMSASDVQEALKDSGPGTTMGKGHDRLRSVLVISEIALACVLLVGAGLLLRSFLKVLNVDLGFEPDHAASIKMEYDDKAADDKASALKRSAIFREAIERVSALPGVEAAGISDYLPLGQNREWGSPVPKGKTYPKDTVLPAPLVYVVTPGFLPAMGARMRGRDFTWSDGPNGQPVVIIDEAAAKFYWPGEDAVGKMLDMGNYFVTVVGVVNNIHEESVESTAGWQIYYPAMQQGPSGAQLVVRTKLPPEALASSVLRTLRELNPDQPAAEFKPIRMLVDRAVSPRRFFVLLVSSFAGLGLLLATLGIYGVISYSVTRQTQEIGIRMALGATQGRVQRTILWKTMRMALLGLAVGVVVSIGISGLIASMLFNTPPTDPPTFGGMTILLAVVALIAGYIPARRASRIDPMIALRTN